MDLYHTGFSGKLLEIGSDEFGVTLTGYVTDKKAEALNNNLNVPAHLIINGEYKDKVAIKTCMQTGELVNNDGVTMMPCFFENGKYQLILENKDNSVYEIFHMDNKTMNLPRQILPCNLHHQKDLMLLSFY